MVNLTFNQRSLPLFRFRVIFLLFLSFITQPTFTQNPFPPNGPVFKDDVVPRIDILIPPDSLAVLLAPGNEESDYHWHATFMFDNGEIQETVENVGFRLRGNTSRYSAKKSFKVSFNTYVPGRQWQGVEKLNLNGEHNDPSVTRSKLCWDLLREMGVPAPRANHVELYINGNYYGLFANVEHIDEEFAGLRYGNKDGNLYKCLWPADLDYLGDNPDLYKYTNGDRRAYELHINEEADDYSDLGHFIDVLNNTPLEDLPCELEKVFNVDTYLKAMAFDVLSGNWDGPLFNKNNFYLYHNEADGRFEYIPYDLDNTLGIDWFNIDWMDRDIYQWAHPDEPRPLYWRLLAVPEYRDRYSHYQNRFVQEIFREEELFPYLDTRKALIAPYVATDPLYPLDYGFTMTDFNNAFEDETPYFHTKNGLKHFITGRRNATLAQLVLNDIPPILNLAGHNTPAEEDDLMIQVRAEDDQQLITIELCYQLNGQGAVSCTTMFDDGAHADGSAGDGLYGAVIPALNETALVHYFIQATDNNGHASRLPRCEDYQLFVGSPSVPLAINEFMASNDGTVADEAGEYDDWVEIYNYGEGPVYLGERYLSDNPDNPDKWSFPDLWLGAGEFLLIWADDDEDQGELHATFKLDADGEFIGIFDDAAHNFGLIDGTAFGTQQTDQSRGRLPDGTGDFQTLSPTPGAPNAPVSVTGKPQTVEKLFAVFPNPVSGELTVRPVRTGAFQLKLIDAQGYLLLNETGQGEFRVDLSPFPAGVYWLQLFEKGRLLQAEPVVRR